MAVVTVAVVASGTATGKGRERISLRGWDSAANLSETLECGVATLGKIGYRGNELYVELSGGDH